MDELCRQLREAFYCEMEKLWHQLRVNAEQSQKDNAKYI